MPRLLELELWYGDLFVAQLRACCAHQGTWFAEYEVKISHGQGSLQDRLIEYIAFCEDFHRRIALGQDHDFAEFDPFAQFADTARWRVPRPDGGSIPMEGRMWFADGQACWQHPETQPSTEIAANEIWDCVAEYVRAHPV